MAFALCAAPHSAVAQSAGDFYRGKDVFLVVGSGSGGGYDLYSRVLARHWGRHIPGNPNVVVQNMPGAGGLTMMNWLGNIARTDGTQIGAAFANTVIEPVFDKGKVTKYDSRTMQWIGSVSPQSIACFTRKDSPVKNVQDAMEKQSIMATTGGSISAMTANVMNTLIGTKFKIVMGYKTEETTLAIERGEAEGTCLSSATLIVRNPDWVTGDKVNWLILMANKPDPLLRGTPLAADFARNDEDRKVIDLIISQLAMGRPYVVPRGVPADRVDILRTSFFETLKDPKFLEEAKKVEMIIDPSDHTEMEKLISYTYSIPDAIVTRAKALIDGTPQEPPKN
jgi:tripartite-type tricarboxylate transporter receptor subunit TctC